MATCEHTGTVPDASAERTSQGAAWEPPDVAQTMSAPATSCSGVASPGAHDAYPLAQRAGDPQLAAVGHQDRRLPVGLRRKAAQRSQEGPKAAALLDRAVGDPHGAARGASLPGHHGSAVAAPGSSSS